jgi:hypothetical protein
MKLLMCQPISQPSPLLIAYLPSIYAAFSRREAAVALEKPAAVADEPLSVG